MPDSSAGLRLTLLFFARVLGGLGLLLLVILGVLRLANLWLEWDMPLDPSEWFTPAAGLILVLVPLGPYVATVGRLAKVKRIPPTPIKSGPAASLRRKQITYGLIGAVGLIFLVILIIMRSVMVWLTFGAMFILMGLLLFYLVWRIGRYERAGNMTIYTTDYSWRFDSTGYVGMLKPRVSQPANKK